MAGISEINIPVHVREYRYGLHQTAELLAMYLEEKANRRNSAATSESLSARDAYSESAALIRRFLVWEPNPGDQPIAMHHPPIDELER